jgi:hypothetical protein
MPEVVLLDISSGLMDMAREQFRSEPPAVQDRLLGFTATETWSKNEVWGTDTALARRRMDLTSGQSRS